MNRDPRHLAKLQDYYAKHGVVPSYSTLMEVVGFHSKNAVAALVGRLKLAGYLVSTSDRRLRPGKLFFERPIYESVPAGRPNVAVDPQFNTISIDDYLVERPSETILVAVKGNSMMGAGIYDGDVVVVERRKNAKLGDIVIAIVDQEFTLKYLDKERGKLILRPANLAYPIIQPKGNLDIFGVVVGQFRKYPR